MIYGEKFLNTSDSIYMNPVTSLALIESQSIEIDNIFNFCFNENGVVLEASIKEVFNGILSKVRKFIVNILNFIKKAIEFISGKLLGLIKKITDKLDKDKSVGESALLEAEDTAKKEYPDKIVFYDWGDNAIKLDSDISSGIRSLNSIADEFIQMRLDYKHKDKSLNDDKFNKDEEYSFEKEFTKFEEAYKKLSDMKLKDFFETKEHNMLSLRLCGDYAFNNCSKTLAKYRTLNVTVNEFKTNYFDKIEKVNNKINAVVNSNSSEYKQHLQRNMNELYSYAGKGLNLATKSCSKLISLYTEAVKANVKALLSVLRIGVQNKTLDKSAYDNFKSETDSFINGDMEPERYIKFGDGEPSNW